MIAAKVNEWYLYHGALEELERHGGLEGVEGCLSSRKEPEQEERRKGRRETDRGIGRERRQRETNE